MNDSTYWFPAQRHGWGWGLPCSWQGWVVLAVYFVVLALGMWLLPPHSHPHGFGIFLTAISGVLMWVCKLKGEPPAWRWGK